MTRMRTVLSIIVLITGTWWISFAFVPRIPVPVELELYQSPMNFEQDEVGANVTSWLFTTNMTGYTPSETNTSHIIFEFAGHYKVLNFSSRETVETNYFFTEVNNSPWWGSIEVWVHGTPCQFFLGDNLGNLATVVTLTPPSSGFAHLRVEFFLNRHECEITLDQTQEDTAVLLPSGMASVTKFGFLNATPVNQTHPFILYLDAIGWTWQGYYTRGENLRYATVQVPVPLAKSTIYSFYFQVIYALYLGIGIFSTIGLGLGILAGILNHKASAREKTA